MVKIASTGNFRISTHANFNYVLVAYHSDWYLADTVL